MKKRRWSGDVLLVLLSRLVALNIHAGDAGVIIDEFS